MNDRRFLPALATAAMLASGGAAADASRVIAVTGSADLSVAPDRATISMSVSARNRDIDAARSEVVATTRRFLAFVDDEGIDDDDVQTTGLNIQPQYRWNREEEVQELTGYLVERQIVVKLEDVGELGTIMEGAVDAGINQVQPPQLRHSNARELRRQVLARAARDARANAEAIAASLDVELGDLHSLNASHGGYQPPRPERQMMAMDAAVANESAAETYSLGQITITAQVAAEFEIADD